jgi:hypothetical protein
VVDYLNLIGLIEGVGLNKGGEEFNIALGFQKDAQITDPNSFQSQVFRQEVGLEHLEHIGGRILGQLVFREKGEDGERDIGINLGDELEDFFELVQFYPARYVKT